MAQNLCGHKSGYSRSKSVWILLGSDTFFLNSDACLIREKGYSLKMLPAILWDKMFDSLINNRHFHMSLSK